MKPERLITIIREDLTPGYQIAQTAHAVANYCLAYNAQALKWHIKGNFMISLSVTDKEELENLSRMLNKVGVEHIMFYESGISEHTSIAFVGTETSDLFTRHLSLAGKYSGNKSKDGDVERGDQ